ncbi:hypothetical protein Q3G72_006179 [Acer saccharum]|nr:hypothetical protein Q3G72_006179 [Acer saccharum]
MAKAGSPLFAKLSLTADLPSQVPLFLAGAMPGGSSEPRSVWSHRRILVGNGKKNSAPPVDIGKSTPLLTSGTGARTYSPS